MEDSEKHQILRERARMLAIEATTEDAGDERIEIVEFMLSGEWYGIESHYIREVYPLKEFTSVPCTPAFVLGVINIRGQVVSIVDIGRFFELPRQGVTELNRVIVLNSGALEFGILADDILGMRRVSMQDVQESLPTLTGIRAEYLKGVTPDRVTVLDAGKILADKKLIVHEEVRG